MYNLSYSISEDPSPVLVIVAHDAPADRDWEHIYEALEELTSNGFQWLDPSDTNYPYVLFGGDILTNGDHDFYYNEYQVMDPAIVLRDMGKLVMLCTDRIAPRIGHYED